MKPIVLDYEIPLVNQDHVVQEIDQYVGYFTCHIKMEICPSLLTGG